MLHDGRTVRAKQFVASTLDVHQTFETLISSEQMPAAFLKKLDGFQYTKWSLYGLHLAMHEPARLTSEAFDRTSAAHAEMEPDQKSMEDLMAAHKDVMAGKVPSLVQFGCGPLSVIDPTQAPPGKHTQICLARDAVRSGSRQAEDYEDFKEEFAEKIIEVFARFAPNMTRKNIIGRHVYTGREYVAEFPQMRGGDIFMGAFNAEQVMYNHFGYRTPIERLYMAGSASASRRGDLRRFRATSVPASSRASLA